MKRMAVVEEAIRTLAAEVEPLSYQTATVSRTRAS